MLIEYLSIPTHFCLIYDSALIQRIPYLVLLSCKQRSDNLILHLSYRLDVFLRKFTCAGFKECQVRLTYLLLLLWRVLRRQLRVGLFYEVYETLSADKALEKLLVLFHILHIVLEIENIIRAIPLLKLSCFIACVRGNLSRILVFMLLLYCRIIEIFKCIDQKDQKV
jgi:hypothetical protein